MAGKDIIMATQKELKRLHVIHKAIEGQITQAEAAKLTRLSDRQIRRLAKRITEEGDNGIVHKSRDRASNRQKPQKFKDRLIELDTRNARNGGQVLNLDIRVKLGNPW
jgi:predicted transcriptional regulator